MGECDNIYLLVKLYKDYNNTIISANVTYHLIKI